MYKRFRQEIYLGLIMLTLVGGFMGGLASVGMLDTRDRVEVEYVQNDDHKGYRLLVFEQQGCAWCVKFREVVAPWYVRSIYQDKAHLTYLHINRQYRRSINFTLNRPVRSTPTLVLVAPDGRELSRMIGSPTSHDDLRRMVEKHVGT